MISKEDKLKKELKEYPEDDVVRAELKGRQEAIEEVEEIIDEFNPEFIHPKLRNKIRKELKQKIREKWYANMKLTAF